jgi:hypothetical protein
MEVNIQIHAPVSLPLRKEPPGTHWLGDWGLMTLSGGSGKERNLVLFPAGKSPFVCDPVLLRTASLTTLSLRETVIKNCGVDGEGFIRMMETETTFETSGLFLPHGFVQDVGPVVIPQACLTKDM